MPRTPAGAVTRGRRARRAFLDPHGPSRGRLSASPANQHTSAHWTCPADIPRTRSGWPVPAAVRALGRQDGTKRSMPQNGQWRPWTVVYGGIMDNLDAEPGRSPVHATPRLPARPTRRNTA